MQLYCLNEDIFDAFSHLSLILLEDVSIDVRGNSRITMPKMKDAPMMIFDEPTSALDIGSRKEFCEYIQKVKKDKIIITVTHDEYLMACGGVILSLSDSIIV